MATQILIVEDERIIAEDLKMMLTGLDFKVRDIADCGEKALEIVAANPVDLVLMDIKIKGAMNGIETTRKMTAQFDVPVIYLTAYADESTVDRVKETDAYGFIVKPANEQTIQGTIELALYKHGMDRKLRERDQQLQHLNQVLLAIRNVSQLITKEVDIGRLIQGACENLTGTMGYQRTWIGLLTEDFFHTFAFSDIQPDMQEALKKTLNAGKYPPCVEMALKNPGLAVVEDPEKQCPVCSAYQAIGEQSRFSMQLKYQNKTYGLISVGVSHKFANQKEEQDLFIELAEEIAFALYRIELEALQKKSAEALRKEKAFTDLALNAQQDTFFVFDPETGRAVRWNEAFEIVSGYSHKEISMQLAPSSYYCDEDLQRAASLIQQVMDERSGTIELLLITKSGRKIPYEYYVSSIEDPESGKSYLVSVGRDISERKQAQEEIAGLAKFPSENPNPVLRISGTGKLLYTNDAAAALFPELLTAKTKKIKKKWLSRFAHCAEKGRMDICEIESAGRYFQLIIAPIPELDYINLYATDISDRIRAERELEEKNRILNAMIQNTDEYIMIADRDAKPVWYNQAYVRIMREMLNLEMQPGINPHKLFGDSLAVEWWEQLHQRVLSGEQFQEEFQYPVDECENRHFEINYYPLKEGGKVTGFTEFTRDITHRKKMEQALKESEQKLKNIIEHSDELFYLHDTSHVLKYVSPQSTRMLEYTPEEMMVKWTSLVTDHPINQQGIRLTKKAIKTGKKQPNYVLELKRKSGEKIFVEVNESPVCDTSGHVVNIVGALRDVTERIHTEEDLQQRMKDLERFNKLMIGRENRMIELKQEVNDLLQQAGLKKKYRIPRES